MKLKFLVPLLLSAFCANATPSGKVEMLEDGLLVHLAPNTPNATRQVKLQVINDHIIHVSATPAASFDTTASLMVNFSAPAGNWESGEKDGLAWIRTRAIYATVNEATGEVNFSDLQGHPILQEQAGGGKTFQPITVDGEHLYHIKQVFRSPKEEAFYGLGQHQTGLMDYKDQDVDLTQYNAIAVTPFLLSTRHYGLLWDNYSISRFGDDRTYQQLDGLQLFDSKGQPGALTATYRQHDTIFTIRREASLDYAYLDQQKDFPKGIDLRNATVRWEGQVSPKEGGLQKFFISGSGYLKIWVDGKLMLDKWRESWNPGPSLFRYTMQKGKRYALKVEWVPDSGESYVSLKYLPPTPTALADHMQLSSEAAARIDYYFIYGATADDIIAGYRTLTGKATLLPSWAFGFWQSRERYKTQAEIMQTAQEFRRRHIGLDNIVEDWSYWKENEWGSHDFDSTRFPDAKGMIDSLHAEHIHFMISVWPKFYEGIANYNAFDARHWLYKKNIENRQRDWIGPGYVSTFYDAYNPGARKLFWQQIKDHLFSKGVDAWWLDASEPDIYSNTSIAQRKQLMNPTALGSSTRYFNAYALENARAVYEGQRAAAPDQRVFILTRSAYAGIQRYAAATWSGDIAARFDELTRQIPAGINFSMSGLPYWTTDIGGFYVEDKYDHPAPRGAALEEWRELNTRWYQFGAFCPLFRSHGQFPYREIYNIAPEHTVYYQSMLYYNQLRYRLMPYLYSMAGAAYHQDGTLMRGLAMDFAGDTAVLHIADQYLFGPSILVNPVHDYKARSRSVYLPKGNGWYNFYTGRYLAGGQHLQAAAPVDTLPLFVKAGSILPAGPRMEYTRELPADTLTLYVYTGADAQFTLYEDEGVNYGYERGAFSNIPLTYHEQAHTLTIGARTGQFPGMLQQRCFRVITISPRHPAGFDTREAGTLVNYNGNATTISLNK